MFFRNVDRVLSGVIRLIARFEITALSAAMIFIIASIALQTVTRYALGRPITWVEEGATYAFIWITFMGASYGAKQGRLVKVELLSNGLGEAGQRWLLAAGQIFMIIGCGYLAWIAPRVIAIESRSLTISLPINVPRAWFYSVPLFYFASVTTFVSLARLYRLVVLGDRTPIVEPFPVEEEDIPLPAKAIPVSAS